MALFVEFPLDDNARSSSADEDRRAIVGPAVDSMTVQKASQGDPKVRDEWNSESENRTARLR